jgi:hypothetical protein
MRGFDLSVQQPVGLPPELEPVMDSLRKHQAVLKELGEESESQEEWWRTRDAGRFKVWRGASTRLLLYPSGGAVYGYSIGEGSAGGQFFFKSRSCKEEGHVSKEGEYKSSEHQISSGRHVKNLDLLFSDGTVLLLRLRPTGAGFKVFPRRVPGAEGSLGG